MQSPFRFGILPQGILRVPIGQREAGPGLLGSRRHAAMHRGLRLGGGFDVHAPVTSEYRRLAGMLDRSIPLYQVPGNHDLDAYAVPGGASVDGRVFRAAGLTVAGLGGSRRYKREGRHQYTEAEMRTRALWLGLRLVLRRLAGRGRLDLLVTHAPARAIHDAPDHTHRGFQAFRGLLWAVRPRLMLHGHVHIAPNLDRRESELYGVRILNVYPVLKVELQT